jgi:hypothetical protein
VPEAITRGLARRAFDYGNPSRLFPHLFAKRLLGPDCPPAKELPESMRKLLEEVAARSGSSKPLKRSRPARV